MTLQPVETLLAAVLVLLLGHLLNRLIPPLAQYNIPAPISGGLLFALGLLLAGSSTGFSLEFDVTLRPVLLLSFFAAVGLSANLALLRQGGNRLPGEIGIAGRGDGVVADLAAFDDELAAGGRPVLHECAQGRPRGRRRPAVGPGI